ncbi:MAG: response regulator [Gemmatimonadota bacterium]
MPTLPAAAPLIANLAALMMEIGAAVLLATLFAVVRRQVKPRAYFELWERAWAVLALSLVVLLARHIPGVPSTLGLLGYQVGKFMFFGLLLLGALAYQRPDRLLPVGPVTAVMAFLGVVTAWLSNSPNTAVAWQSPFAMVLCGVSAWLLGALPSERKTFGTHATSVAMLVYALTWALYGVAILASETTLSALLSSPVRHRMYLDTLTLGGLGFGMVLLVMEDARRIARESEERLQMLIASTTDALLLLDSSLRVQAVNPAAERLFDTSAATILGRDLLSLVEVNDAVALRDAMMRFASGGGPEFRVGESEPTLARRSAGAAVRVDGALWRLPGDRGEMAAILRDVTVREELRTRQAMQAKTDAVRQLAAGIAHDFNNVLTTISTSSHLLLGEFDGDHRVRDTVAEIAQATASAGRLARDLLALSGRQSLQPTLLDVNMAVRALEDAVRSRLPCGVTADFRYAVDAGRVRVDGVRFGDAVLAIVQNAGEAMEATGGRMLVATARGMRVAEARAAGVDESAEYAYVSVHDTGLGLSVESRAHVFEPYYTTKGAGRGLGLPTAFGFAQQSDGWLSLQSSPAGTIVRLGFPLSQDDALPSSGAVVARAASDAPAPERYALLAEDDDTVRRVVRLVLLREGFQVIEAANGMAALEAWQASRQALAVLVADVEMPLMGGPELARRLLQMHPGLRVILMSGYVADDALRAAIPGADVAFLQKPFDVSDLLRVVRNEPKHT